MEEKQSEHRYSDHFNNEHWTPEKKKRKLTSSYKRKLPPKLLQDSRFISWIDKSKRNANKGFCKVCHCEISGGVTQFERHGSTEKHFKNSLKQTSGGTDPQNQKDPDNLEINGEPNAEAIFISVPPAETSGSVSLEASSCESPLKNRNSVTFQPIKTVTVPSGKISEYHGSIRAEDEFDLFGKSMASHLRKMPLLAALECQSKIQSYIIQKRIEITSSSDVSIKQGQ